MKKIINGLSAMLLIVAVGFFAGAGSVSADDVNSLRGPIGLDETNQAPAVSRQDKSQQARAYRQAPPLIPHRIDGYQIDMKVNKCMTCHDWPASNEMGAPKISETHYRDRDGVAVDYVSRNRWFCTQCHVPQVDASPLVKNEFKAATQVQ